LNRAIDEYRREYEVLVDAVTNSQKGVFSRSLLHQLRFWSK